MWLPIYYEKSHFYWLMGRSVIFFNYFDSQNNYKY